MQNSELLNAEEIEQKLIRMAYEIAERHYNEKNIVYNHKPTPHPTMNCIFGKNKKSDNKISLIKTNQLNVGNELFTLVQESMKYATFIVLFKDKPVRKGRKRAVLRLLPEC
jgi:hypothetical protein